MTRTIILYAIAIAIAATVLEWIEYKYVTRVFSTEIYVVLIAAGFTMLGVWAGRRLTAKPNAGPFEKNAAALAALGVTDREYEVLELLAAGHSNKEIARRLDVSPNTVKTHIGKLYDKLEVERRTQAVEKARSLALIP
ncbi:MAG: response regulator transcription factor [Parvularculaceae bacterium]